MPAQLSNTTRRPSSLVMGRSDATSELDGLRGARIDMWRSSAIAVWRKLDLAPNKRVDELFHVFTTLVSPAGPTLCTGTRPAGSAYSSVSICLAMNAAMPGTVKLIRPCSGE